MAAGQQWLFAPARPLVERLGRRFFREIPTNPGVYSMRDASGEVVYVGKAKNLRRRLRSYRVANPERVSRRHLRLMREVVRIEFDLCATESTALAHEARLLRRLKPRFNRAGIWPGRAQFLTWRFADASVQFAVHEVPPLGWERFGPLGGSAPRLLGSLVRLLWLALHPQAGFSCLPQGWTHNHFPVPITMTPGSQEPEIRQALEHIFWAEPAAGLAWLRGASGTHLPAFEQAARLADLGEIESFVANRRNRRGAHGNQLALL